MREGYTVIDLKSVVDEAKKSEGFSNKSLLAATMASFPRAVFQTAVLNEDGDGFDNDYKGEQRLQASTRQKTGRKNKKQQALQRKLIGFVKQVEAAYPTWVKGPNDVILKNTVMVHQVPTGDHVASVQCLHTDFPMGPPSEPRGKLAVIVACDTCSILVTPYSHHMVRQFGNRRDDAVVMAAAAAAASPAAASASAAASAASAAAAAGTGADAEDDEAKDSEDDSEDDADLIRLAVVDGENEAAETEADGEAEADEEDAHSDEGDATDVELEAPAEAADADMEPYQKADAQTARMLPPVMMPIRIMLRRGQALVFDAYLEHQGDMAPTPFRASPRIHSYIGSNKQYNKAAVKKFREDPVGSTYPVTHMDGGKGSTERMASHFVDKSRL